MLLQLLLAALCAASIAEPQLSDQEMVNYLNGEQHLFEAGLPTISEGEFQSRLMDAKYLEEDQRVYGEELEINEDIPVSFDTRVKWPQCLSISTIRDQANCGSCWAVSAASVMSDRACTQSNGRVKTIVSDTDILSCCGYYCGSGCQGGYPTKAWEYAMASGGCTGGPYRKRDVCKPYPFHPCGRHINQTYYGECRGTEKTPKCRKTCQLGYPIEYEKDKIYAKSSYTVPRSEQAIQKEIMTNGPVQAGFYVYSDFRYYKKGIYRHTSGYQQGAHAIKIIGWGVENGTKYWTIANSWNSDWGEDGYFRMIRGINDCNLEGWVNTGMMKV